MAIVILLIVLYSLTPVFVLAQSSSPLREETFNQLRAAGGTAGGNLGEYKDPRQTVARIIKISLELIGTIFIVLAVYAGFLWMTAAGEEENITKAKSMLRAAVIGVLIVLSALSITYFVFDVALRSTGDGTNPLDLCDQDPSDPRCAP